MKEQSDKIEYFEFTNQDNEKYSYNQDVDNDDLLRIYTDHEEGS